MERANKVRDSIYRIISAHELLGSFEFLGELRQAYFELEQQHFGAASSKLLMLRDHPFLSTVSVPKLKIKTLLKMMITIVIPDMLEQVYQTDRASLYSPQFRYDHCSSSYEVYFMRCLWMEDLALLDREWHNSMPIPPVQPYANAGEAIHVLAPQEQHSMELLLHEEQHNWQPAVAESESESESESDASTVDEEYVQNYGIVMAIHRLTRGNPACLTFVDNFPHPLISLNFRARLTFEPAEPWTINVLSLLSEGYTAFANALMIMPANVRDSMLQDNMPGWQYDDNDHYYCFWLESYRVARHIHGFTHDEAHLVACRLELCAYVGDVLHQQGWGPRPCTMPLHADTFNWSDNHFLKWMDEISDPDDVQYNEVRYNQAKSIQHSNMTMSVM
jgi:hypothetical protein